MDFTVENAGTTIACREYAGPDVSSDTPALVCVHGACVDGVFFDAIARELACDYRVITYDRRGCGESGDAADGRYDLAVQSRPRTCRPLSSILALRQTCSRTVPVRWWPWIFSVQTPP